MRTYSSGMPSCRRGIAAFNKRVPSGNLPSAGKGVVGAAEALAFGVGMKLLLGFPIG